MPLYQQQIQHSINNTKTPPETLITQRLRAKLRLHNDCMPTFSILFFVTTNVLLLVDNFPRRYYSGSNIMLMKKKVNMKVAETSPTIKRSQTAVTPDTGKAAEVGVPRIVLQGITKSGYIVSDDNNLWYKNTDRVIQIKPCDVNVVDVLKDHMFPPSDCTISKCGSTNYKTCNILITDNSFSSNFTKRSFKTHSFDNLSCKSANLEYGIDCSLCGLIYVGETMPVGKCFEQV